MGVPPVRVARVWIGAQGDVFVSSQNWMDDNSSQTG